jgi:hypothetical protein
MWLSIVSCSTARFSDDDCESAGSPQNHCFRQSHSTPHAQRTLHFEACAQVLPASPGIRRCRKRSDLKSAWHGFVCFLGRGDVLPAQRTSILWATEHAAALMRGAHIEGIAQSWDALKHDARRVSVIARYRMATALSALTPWGGHHHTRGGGTEAVDTVRATAAVACPASSSSGCGSDGVSGAPTASQQATQIQGLWQALSAPGDCSLGSRKRGTCHTTSIVAKDYWHLCSTESVCIDMHDTGQSDRLCGLFQAAPIREAPRTSGRLSELVGALHGRLSEQRTWMMMHVWPHATERASRILPATHTVEAGIALRSWLNDSVQQMWNVLGVHADEHTGQTRDITDILVLVTVGSLLLAAASLVLGVLAPLLWRPRARIAMVRLLSPCATRGSHCNASQQFRSLRLRCT